MIKNSAVKMAGVTVGIIKEITLEDNLARIDLSVQGHLQITRSSKIEIRALGLLGNKHVEIILGNPSDPMVQDGGQILSARDTGSLQAIMNEVGQISKQLGEVAESLNTATTNGDNTTPLGRIVLNIEALTADLRDVVGGNKEKMNNIITQVDSITKSIDQFINDEGDEGFKTAWKKVTKSLSKLDKTINNVEEITGKINDGEGTLGRLVNDEETVEEVNAAVANINSLLDQINQLETSIDIHSEYLTDIDENKTFIGVRLQPGPDRYYELAIVDDPEGVTRQTTTAETSGGTTNTTVTETTFNDKVKFTALFAKNFWNWTLKGGLIESEGGVAVDYYLLDRKLRLSVEAFDFEDTQIRAFARYDFWRGVYLVAGGDNLTDSAESSPFFGFGLFLNNDDLRLFLAGAPIR